MLTTVTSYASVRAVLGVNERVISDVVLANDVFDLALAEDLESVGAGLGRGDSVYDDYLDAASIALTDKAARSFVNSASLFAAHSVAVFCIKAIPELSPILVSDSKASFKKDRGVAVEALRADYSRYRRKLVETYAGYLGVDPPVYAPALGFGVSSPSYDPVTGA